MFFVNPCAFYSSSMPFNMLYFLYSWSLVGLSFTFILLHENGTRIGHILFFSLIWNVWKGRQDVKYSISCVIIVCSTNQCQGIYRDTIWYMLLTWQKDDTHERFIGQDLFLVFFFCLAFAHTEYSVPFASISCSFSHFSMAFVCLKRTREKLNRKKKHWRIFISRRKKSFGKFFFLSFLHILLLCIRNCDENIYVCVCVHLMPVFISLKSVVARWW